MKIILAGYSSELIRLIKKCDLKIVGIVEPDKNVKISNQDVFNSDEEAIKTISPDGVIIGIDNISRKKIAHSIYRKNNGDIFYPAPKFFCDF